jgi:hypothetical protein
MSDRLASTGQREVSRAPYPPQGCADPDSPLLASLVNHLGERLNFERSHVNRAPAWTVQSLGKVAPAQGAPAKGDRPSVLLDPMSNRSGGTDVVFAVHLRRPVEQ